MNLPAQIDGLANVTLPNQPLHLAIGVFDTATVLKLMLTQWVLKVVWEALLTPVTYAVVGWLKRREGVDVFDRNTDFTPFKAEV